jgi:hypothetical protein
MSMFNLPVHPERKYAAANFCIYCRSKGSLSDEHVIPLGLGERWILPKASCAACAKSTSQSEKTCLRTMFGPLRMYYNMPSR